MLDIGGLVWWQWWLLLMVTINTCLNAITFYQHRKTSRQGKLPDVKEQLIERFKNVGFSMVTIIS